MKKKYINYKIQKDDNGNMTIVASDETLDRMGEVVPLDSWDLTNYKKNPVLLVDHEYKVANIVGRATNIKLDQKALTFTPEFHGLTQLSKEVEAMVNGDFAPAVSVGFLPHGPSGDGEKTMNELLEISFVSVPANPNALALAMKSFDEKQEKAVEDWLKVKGPVADELAADEVMEQKCAYLHEVFEIMYAFSDVYMDEATPVDDIGKLLIETAGLLTDFANNPTTEDDEETETDPTMAGIKIYSKKAVATLVEELAALKEGRVLSGSNRDKISECSIALKQAATLLDDLLNASNTNSDKASDEHKGRATEVVNEVSVPKKARSSVLRALQDINKTTNVMLRELKENAQS